MAKPEHVAIVKKGAIAIQEWRQEHPQEFLNLIDARLIEADFSSANLEGADFSRAILARANFYRARLSVAKICRAILCDANLTGADLYKSDFSEADLSRAVLSGANLSRANLSAANLSDAILYDTNLSGAKLSGANLSRATLSRVNLSGASISDADFKNAKLLSITIGSCNLAQATGLETVEHLAPSSIGVDTLIESYRSAGNRLTSELKTFFINGGMPREIIEALPQIVAKVKYYSAFISYGEPDTAFAENLGKTLKARGVPCWLYSANYTVGDPTWKEIKEAMNKAEKIIVLCSAKSLIRDGVLKEIEEQIDESPEKIVQVSLDNLWRERGFRVMRGERDLKPFILYKNFADFSDERLYEDSLDKLLKGLERKDKPT